MGDGFDGTSRWLRELVGVVSVAVESQQQVPASVFMHCDCVLPKLPAGCGLDLGHAEGRLRVVFEEEAGDCHCNLFSEHLLPPDFIC